VTNQLFSHVCALLHGGPNIVVAICPHIIVVCVGHVQVADITFNFWNRLSELLYDDKKTSSSSESWSMFKPYITRLIIALCRLCQYDPHMVSCRLLLTLRLCFFPVSNLFSVLYFLCSVWARERCTISPLCFLAECRKKRLNQASFVLLCFVLFAFSGCV